MGKKPVVGLIGALWVGVTLTGCGECCRGTDGSKFSPKGTFTQGSTGASGNTTQQAWNSKPKSQIGGDTGSMTSDASARSFDTKGAGASATNTTPTWNASGIQQTSATGTSSTGANGTWSPGATNNVQPAGGVMRDSSGSIPPASTPSQTSMRISDTPGMTDPSVRPVRSVDSTSSDTQPMSPLTGDGTPRPAISLPPPPPAIGATPSRFGSPLPPPGTSPETLPTISSSASETQALEPPPPMPSKLPPVATSSTPSNPPTGMPSYLRHN
jgi:hypothetical protein